jgi:hypothetical protein
MATPELERDVPAHRQPAHDRSLDAKSIEQCDEVIGETDHVEDVTVAGLGRAEAAQVGRDSSPARRQRCQLPAPHRRIEGKPVNEEDGVAASAFAPLDVDAVHWHSHRCTVVLREQSGVLTLARSPVMPE